MATRIGISAKFWGVRGIDPTPLADTTGFGGNTPCLEIRLPSGEILIIDGGTGARQLGAQLMRQASGESLSLHFFLTHFHWDHIQGIPFFQPLYSKENTVTFYAMTPPAVTAETLEGQMSIPYFPVDFKFLPAKRKFVRLPGASSTLAIRGLPAFRCIIRKAAAGTGWSRAPRRWSLPAILSMETLSMTAFCLRPRRERTSSSLTRNSLPRSTTSGGGGGTAPGLRPRVWQNRPE